MQGKRTPTQLKTAVIKSKLADTNISLRDIEKET